MGLSWQRSVQIWRKMKENRNNSNTSMWSTLNKNHRRESNTNSMARIFFVFFFSRQSSHLFEDKTFTISTACALCNRKIWMKVGRQCRDCQITIHKKCEDKVTSECSGIPEPGSTKSHGPSTSAEEEAKSLVHVELSNSDHPMITTTEEIDSVPVKNNYDVVPMSNNPRMGTPTTAHRITTKAAAALSVLDSTARRSFRAFGNKPVHPATSVTPTLTSTSELSRSEESLTNTSLTLPLSNPNKPSTVSNPPVHTSSKLANAASSAYSKLREFKTKRLPASSPISVPAPESNAIGKARTPSDSRKYLFVFCRLLRYIFWGLFLGQSENFSESDLRVAISVRKHR